MTFFTAGSKVRICGEDSPFYSEYGVIRDKRGEGDTLEFLVNLPAMDLTYWFHRIEVEPVVMVELAAAPPTPAVPAQPAAGEADDAPTLLKAIQLMILTGANPDAKATMIVAFVEEYTRELQAKLDAVTGELKSANDAVDFWRNSYQSLDASVADARKQLVGELVKYADRERKQVAENARLREALDTSVRALVRGKPQIKGVLVMQDFEWAIEAAHKALLPASDGAGNVEG